MRYKLITLFFISIINLASAKAQLIPQFIVDDIKHEIVEVDSINLSLEEKKALVGQIETRRNMSYSDIDQLLEKYIETKPIVAAALSTEIIEIKPTEIKSQQSHSIHQLDQYIKNRIGVGTFDEVKKGQTDVLIFGGDINSLNEYLKVQTKIDFTNLKRIPSLYEQWGLSKFYASHQINGQKAVLIWVVPPSIRYVRHYSTMFSALPNVKVKSFVDLKAYETVEKLSKSKAESIIKKNKIDYISFGYNRLWKKALAADVNLVLLGEYDVQDSVLQSALKVMQIYNKQSKQTTSIGLFSSEKTVWGELAAAQLKSFLNPELKGLIFMGSAGSLMNEINPYDLSVPKAFYRPGQTIKIDNFINQQKTILDANQNIHFDRNHGNTFSPLEQNKKYVGRLEALNIQTLDVEQSLIAEAVSDYNRKNKTDIKFGAVNLITDKPFSVLTKEPVKNSLDHLNSYLKEKARLNAVKLSLASILNNEKNNSNVKCVKLFSN